MRFRIPLALMLAAALGGAAIAGDIDEGAKGAFDAISSSWSGEDSGGVCGYLPKGDAKVSFYLDGQASGSYSSKQAKGVLSAYFGRVDVLRVSLRKDGYSGGGKQYSATYDYEYSTPDGAKHSSHLQFSISEKDGRWVLQSATVD